MFLKPIPPMKISPLTSAITIAMLAFMTSSSFADEPKRVAFRTPNKTYIGMEAQGRLITNAKSVTGKQTFALTDANGGDLADGDSVVITTTGSDPKTKPTYWQETSDGKIGRIGKKDAACSFIVKHQGSGITLKTASGKFVKVGEGGLTTTDQESEASVLEIVEQPAGETQPAGSPSASPAKETE